MVSLDSVHQPSLMEMARTGDLRAIAYWINSFLAPQGIYVRVGVTRLGCLHLLVEFEQQPNQTRLVRFLCHRLCRLKSELIGTVRIAARPLGSRRTAWTQTVRLLSHPPSHQRRQPASQQPAPQQRSLPPTVQARPGQARPIEQPAKTKAAAQTAHRRAASKRTTAIRTTAIAPATNPIATIMTRTDRMVRPLGPSALRRRRRRAIALSSSAIVAFAIGCSFEIAHRQNLTAIPRQSSSTGIESANNRPDTVNIAGEQLAVTQQATVDPADPIVTLTFSSESALGSVTAENDGAIAPDLTTPNAWDLSSMEGYRQADVVLTSLDSTPSRGLTDANAISAFAVEALTAGSVDVVNLASDRLIGAGENDLAKTLDTLQQVGIHTIGAGRNDREARRPEILDVKGQRVAYLGYSDSDLHAAHSWSAGINPAVSTQIAADIQSIRSQVDWVIVNYQWNQELAEYPGDQQMNLARFAVDQGADLVVGHHADVLQGAEIYKGRAIAYSLGNFIFADNPYPVQTDHDTAVLKVSLRDRQMRLEFLPVQVRQSKPAIVSGEKAQQILQYIQQASGLFDQPLQSPTVLDLQSATHSAPFNPTPSDPIVSPNPTPFTAPVSPTSPDDSFTTYPKIPTGGAREINHDASVYPQIEVHDSFDRLDTPPTAEPVNFKQENPPQPGQFELQKTLPQVQPSLEQEPQNLQEFWQLDNQELQPLAPQPTLQPESSEPEDLGQEHPTPASPSQPAEIDTIATAPSATAPAMSSDAIETSAIETPEVDVETPEVDVVSAPTQPLLQSVPPSAALPEIEPEADRKPKPDIEPKVIPESVTELPPN
jgi:hypothetical protein